MAADRWKDLKARTKQYALRIIPLFRVLPKAGEAREIGQQLLCSGMSVGANFREATRARSAAEFASKANVSLIELDESRYWLELLEESGILPAKRLSLLLGETDERIAIFVTIIKNAKGD